MKILVTHPRIVKNAFDYSVANITQEVSSLDEAGDYFREQQFDLLPELAPVQPTSEGVSPSNELLGIDIAMPWHISFYQHVGHKGDRFKLGVVHQTHPIVALNPAVLASIDWDVDLTKRKGPCNKRWNNCISSIKSHSYAKGWALFEDTKFRGSMLFGVGDHKSLPVSGWNDRCSSIIMSSASPDLARIAIGILQAVRDRL